MKPTHSPAELLSLVRARAETRGHRLGAAARDPSWPSGPILRCVFCGDMALINSRMREAVGNPLTVTCRKKPHRTSQGATT